MAQADQCAGEREECSGDWRERKRIQHFDPLQSPGGAHHRRNSNIAPNTRVSPAARESQGPRNAIFSRRTKAARAITHPRCITPTLKSTSIIAQFGQESVRIFTEAQGIWSRLGGAVENAGVSFATVRGEIDAAARAMQDATAVGDEDFARALTRLVTLTGDYSGSLKRMQLVAGVAVGAQIGVAQAADVVGRALTGQTRVLRQLGITTDDASEGLRQLQERFRGAAEREGQTLQGQLKRLNNEWGDFKEAVGAAMVEAGGGASVMETLIGGLRGLNRWVTNNQETIQYWGQLGCLGRRMGGARDQHAHCSRTAGYWIHSDRL